MAIGVNDAIRGKVSPSHTAEWEKLYSKMLNLALQVSPSVTVLTILPVEEGMPLGDRYFDPERIDRLNALIQKAAKDQGTHLIDAHKHFANARWWGHYTIDGVHLTPMAYRFFSEIISIGLIATCPP